MTPESRCCLTIVIPCYNEEATLEACVNKVLEIQGPDLDLEILIVDDASRDNSLKIAQDLAQRHPQVKSLSQPVNQGKGAALRTGFQQATGDFVAVQDADLEYDPRDLRELIQPLKQGKADVVLGSRYLTGKAHRVLFFWHTLGNKFLTLLSNMFTDLNLTDMETCYKVFKREVIQAVEIKENRFGFEPEIVAKMAQMGVRIYEIGISYNGRTYDEGKKIGLKDGFRALYCIFRYNAPQAPLPIQFLIYLFIGGSAALFNLGAFLGLTRHLGLTVEVSATIAYFAAALVNYLLCIVFLFRRNARWNSFWEMVIYGLVVLAGAVIDVASVTSLLAVGFGEASAKALASVILLLANFWMRRALVFPERKKAKRPTPSP